MLHHLLYTIYSQLQDFARFCKLTFANSSLFLWLWLSKLLGTERVKVVMTALRYCI